MRLRGIRKKLFDYFLSKVKLWGVEFESNLPPEFLISYHAEQRLKERIGVSQKKMKKIVVKAWNTKSIPINKLNRAEYNAHRKDNQYREMMGYVFVFRYSKNRQCFPPQKVLLSVF